MEVGVVPVLLGGGVPLLPNADRPKIDPRKLHGYLLSATHQVGRFKACFFAALGYSAAEWRNLEADLRA